MTAMMGEEKENASQDKDSQTKMMPKSDTDETETETETETSSVTPRFRRFMLSSVPDKERQEFAAFLVQQGAECSDLNMCDPAATHIVAQKLSRSEKMLGSIASGKWVLHPSYMVECMLVGKLLHEEVYEWGDPDRRFVRPDMSELEKALAAASRRSRLRKVKTFAGFRAIIHTTPQRIESFRRLVELGGGEVLDVSPPYSDARGATPLSGRAGQAAGRQAGFPVIGQAGAWPWSPPSTSTSFSSWSRIDFIDFIDFHLSNLILLVFIILIDFIGFYYFN